MRKPSSWPWPPTARSDCLGSWPADLAAAGFGDIELAEALEPGLTTVRIESDDIGRRAGRMLLARLGGGAAQRGIELVELSLVVRASG